MGTFSPSLSVAFLLFPSSWKFGRLWIKIGYPINDRLFPSLQVLYSEFLRALREKPKLLAACLTSGDRLNVAETAEVLSAMFSGLYGSCLMPDDEQLVLQLLHDLMRLQLTSAANPRDDFVLEGS